jgi:hypothetical protein
MNMQKIHKYNRPLVPVYLENVDYLQKNVPNTEPRKG